MIKHPAPHLVSIFFLCVMQRVREEPEKPKAFLHPAAVEGKAPRKDSSSCESRRLQNSHRLLLCRARAKLTARLRGRTGNTVCQPTQRLCCALFPPPCSLSYLIDKQQRPPRAPELIAENSALQEATKTWPKTGETWPCLALQYLFPSCRGEISCQCRITVHCSANRQS